MAERKIEDWQTDWNKAKTDEERQKALDDYRDAKLYNAEQREWERLNRPSKFSKAIKKIKALFGVKVKEAVSEQQKQH